MTRAAAVEHAVVDLSRHRSGHHEIPQRVPRDAHGFGAGRRAAPVDARSTPVAGRPRRSSFDPAPIRGPEADAEGVEDGGPHCSRSGSAVKGPDRSRSTTAGFAWSTSAELKVLIVEGTGQHRARGAPGVPQLALARGRPPAGTAAAEAAQDDQLRRGRHQRYQMKGRGSPATRHILCGVGRSAIRRRTRSSSSSRPGHADGLMACGHQGELQRRHAPRSSCGRADKWSTAVRTARLPVRLQASNPGHPFLNLFKDQESRA